MDSLFKLFFEVSEVVLAETEKKIPALLEKVKDPENLKSLSDPKNQKLWQDLINGELKDIKSKFASISAIHQEKLQSNGYPDKETSIAAEKFSERGTRIVGYIDDIERTINDYIGML